jgi:hypothetical protein
MNIEIGLVQWIVIDNGSYLKRNGAKFKPHGSILIDNGVSLNTNGSTLNCNRAKLDNNGANLIGKLALLNDNEGNLTGNGSILNSNGIVSLPAVIVLLYNFRYISICDVGTITVKSMLRA